MDQPWWGSREAPALTISEAARICGVRRRAIRRRQQAGEFVNSFRDADGTWRIPLSDLTAAGLEPQLESDPGELRIVSAPASHVERLRTEVAVLRERVRALEIIAREREERVQDLRTILRMLPTPSEIDGLSAPGTEEVLPIEVLGPPLIDEEALSEEIVPEDVALSDLSAEAVVPEEVAAEVMAPDEAGPKEVSPEELSLAESILAEDEVEVPPPQPGRVPAEASPEEEATSPLGAPARVGASTATASVGSATEPAPSSGPERISPPVPQPEPIVVLPDAVRAESARSEEPRQRPAELLEDAMSLWWPAPQEPGPGESEPPPSPDMADEWLEAASESARRQWEPDDQSEEAPSVTEAPHEPEDSDVTEPLSSDSYVEASYDWIDPGFGRPPRHRRRRLGRFFRRYRRPR